MRVSFKQYQELLIKYLHPQRGWVWLLAALLCGNIGLQLINPQILRRFLDTALAGEGTESLTGMALTFIGLAVAQQILSVMVTYLGENVAWTATNWMRYDLARHCLNLDMSSHNQQTPGAMIERIDGDVNTLSNFFSQFIVQVLANGLLLVGILILLYRESTQVGLALTLFVLITLFILNKMRNIAVPYWKQSREASATYFGFLEERLAGTEDIRACGAKAYVMRRFFELLRYFWQTTLKARLMGFLIMNTTWLLFSVGTAIALVLGAVSYQAGAMTLGTVYLIFHYTNMLSQPIERISHEIERLQEAGAGIARIQALWQIESRLPPQPPSVEVSPSAVPQKSVQTGPLSVSFVNVSFAYAPSSYEPAACDTFAHKTNGHQGGQRNGAQPDLDSIQNGLVGKQNGLVLRDLSFDLTAGKVLGLLGRTGSGKTTLTRLLFRLYDPLQGQVCLGDVDVRLTDLLALRQRVGMVTQNVQLFHASVRDNLTFFDPSISDTTILETVYDLGLGDWYEALTAGLDTVLKSGSGGLSAGEAQLLALTRIFLKDPGLVILDEASSRLDPATEQLIERAIDRLLHNRTGIIIAHRLATVQRADEIMILDQGCLREYGQRRQLAHDSDSHFYQLLQTGLEEVLV